MTVALTMLASGALAGNAGATYHVMKVSEFFPGTNADPDSAFIELQMYTDGQNLVSGHDVITYTSTGTLLSSFTIPGNAGSGQNQRTILIGDSSVVGRDFAYDALGDAAEPNRAAGAVCFPDASPPDCVSFGMFTGAGMLPGVTGAPVLLATGIPDGSSITRSISRGCATLLEAGDDTDDSLADFTLTAPSPRNNATAPTETACPSSGTPGKKKRVRRCKKKPSKNVAAAAKKKKCKKKKNT